MPTSCSCMTRPAEDKFMSEGQGVKRYRRDVQRLRHRRAEDRSGAYRRRKRRRRCAAQDRRGKGALRLARRSLRHARGRTAAVERWRASISRQAKGAGIARSARAWARRSTWRRRRTPICCRTAAPGCRSRTAANCRSDRGRQAAVQPVWRHAGQSGQTCQREGEGRTGLHRLADLAEGQKTIAGYKVGGEQLFFPNASH